jgi:putative inorganic carbon (HCO3(-)) transporter
MTFFYEWRVNHPLLRGKLAVLLIGVIGTALALGLMVANQPLLAFGLEIGILLALAPLAWPNVATLVVIFVLYSNAAGVAVDIHNVPKFFGAAVPIVLIIPLASYLIFRRQKIIVTPILPLVFLFLLIQVMGTLVSSDIRLATTGLMTFVVEGVVVYFLITNVVRTPKLLRLVIWALLLAGAFMGLLSLYQQATHTFHNNYWGFAQVSNAAIGTGARTIQGEVTQPRLAGPIGEKNRYAQIMLMLVPLGLFRFWGERSKWLRILAVVATGLCALGVALTFSRGAAAGFILMLIVMTFMRYIKPYQVGLILLGLALLLVAVPQYGARVTTLQGIQSLFSDEEGVGAAKADNSIQGRANLNIASLLVFVDHPVIGVGPDMFRYYYQDYAERAGFVVTEGNRPAHNLYLGVAADNGALGFICFMAILFVTLRNLARARRRWTGSQPDLAHMATGFMLALVTYMTTGIFLHFAYIRYFWLILALASAASYAADIETSAAATMSEKAARDGGSAALQTPVAHI